MQVTISDVRETLQKPESYSDQNINISFQTIELDIKISK